MAFKRVEFIEKGSWRPYAPTATRALSEQFSRGQSHADLEIAGSAYYIDFERRIQSKVETGYTRSIRWEDIDGKMHQPACLIECSKQSQERAKLQDERKRQAEAEAASVPLVQKPPVYWSSALTATASSQYDVTSEMRTRMQGVVDKSCTVFGVGKDLVTPWGPYTGLRIKKVAPPYKHGYTPTRRTHARAHALTHAHARAHAVTQPHLCKHPRARARYRFCASRTLIFGGFTAHSECSCSRTASTGLCDRCASRATKRHG